MADKAACLTYIKRVATFYFTGETVCCARCPACETYSRKQCRLTGIYIMDDRTVDAFCPLIDPDTGEVEGGFNKEV